MKGRSGPLRSMLVGVLVGAIAGCGSISSTPSPTAPPVLGLDWARAASVERPEVAFTAPSPIADPSNPDPSGRSGHPLHFPGQAIISDVASLPSGTLVAIGYVAPGWHPIAWTSVDGQSWQLHPMGNADDTFPLAMAVGADGTIVAVGRSGSAPLSWTSRDGATWQDHPVAVLGTGSAERLTTVVASADGFLAGGSVGPELTDRHARFWRSRDGNTWRPVVDSPSGFANAEVTSIARLHDEFVAVGVVGGVQHPTGSVAWASADGTAWDRIDSPAFVGGRAVAVVAGPGSMGVAAVGSDLDDREALAWISADGRTWTRAPGEPSRQFNGKIRMTDVVEIGGTLVAVGNYAPLQRSTAISWTSTDGLHWTKGPGSAGQEQAEFYAVAAGGPGLVAVGSVGGPDDYVPVIWLSPGR